MTLTMCEVQTNHSSKKLLILCFATLETFKHVSIRPHTQPISDVKGKISAGTSTNATLFESSNSQKKQCSISIQPCVIKC